MTDSDAKEWVTIKVPKSVRDKARGDNRTYGEIMTAGVALPLQLKTVNRFKRAKEATGGDVPEMHADEFLNSLLDTREEVQEHGYNKKADEPNDDLREQLDRIESAASTAEERTGQIQGTLEDMGARR